MHVAISYSQFGFAFIVQLTVAAIYALWGVQARNVCVCFAWALEAVVERFSISSSNVHNASLLEMSLSECLVHEPDKRANCIRGFSGILLPVSLRLRFSFFFCNMMLSSLLSSERHIEGFVNIIVFQTSILIFLEIVLLQLKNTIIYCPVSRNAYKLELMFELHDFLWLM